MLQRLRWRIATNIILVFLVVQMRHMVGIYEQGRFDFDVPTIQHLQKTPVESYGKNLYRTQPVVRVNDENEHRGFDSVTATVVYGAIFL